MEKQIVLNFYSTFLSHIILFRLKLKLKKKKPKLVIQVNFKDFFLII
jgi:hypothetical protein